MIATPVLTKLWSFAFVCLAAAAFAALPRVAQALSVNLSATPHFVGKHGASRLTWTSRGARSCWSRGSWGQKRRLNGSFNTGPLERNTWYGITCSNGKQRVSDSVTVVVGRAQPRLSLSLSAWPRRVDAGRSTTLRWSSSGAVACWSRGVWGSKRPLNGSFRTGRLDRKTWYGITCTNGRRRVSDSVTVEVRDVSVTLDARPAQVRKGTGTTLTWRSSWATSCRAGGAWGGQRSLSGRFHTGPLYRKTYYQLVCTNGRQSAFTSLTVDLAKAPVVRWRAPTRNEDGSRLTDLAGYWFYWGNRSRHYIGRARIHGNWTRYHPAHLSRGSYYVAVTAVDVQGHESHYSNEIRIWVP